MLDLNSTARSVHGACELNQDTVTRSLDDTAAMLGDFWFQKFATMRIEPQQGAFLISSHHSAVTGHVAGKDGRKPSFDPRTHHKNRPDLVATTQVYGGGSDDVRFGSKADISACPCHVRFTP